MSESFTNMLYLLGFFQGVYISVLLLKQRPLKPSAIYLGLFIIVISIEVLNQTDFKFPIDLVYWLNNGNLFLIGPLLFLFVRTIQPIDNSFEAHHLIHMIPFIIIKIATMVLGPTGLGEKWLPDTFFLVLNLFLSVHGLSYAVATVSISRKYLLQEAKSLNKWIFRLSVIHFFGWTFSIVAKVVVIGSELLSDLFWISAYLSMVVIIYFIGVEFMVIPRYLVPYASKYDRSRLKAEEIEELSSRLKKSMVEEKDYLDASLSREKLAQKLGVSAHGLSQFLNEHVGMDFHQLIQKYRIEEVKDRLVDPKYAHYSILGIALDCGFTTKSTFNRSFKMYTGQTPSAFVSALKNSSTNE